MRRFFPLLLVALLAAAPALAESDFTARFETLWTLIDDRYWDLNEIAADWDEVGERYREQVEQAGSEDEYFALMQQMYAEIGDDHSVFVPPSRVQEIRQLYGDLPCLALLGQAQLQNRIGTISYELVQLDSGHSAGLVRVPDLASDFVNRDLRSAVAALVSEGAAGFVLDLRGNPGGRLITMMQAAGVFTTGFLWRTVTTWSLPIPYPAIGVPETGAPLAVLIDGDVHSAGEGLAGALRQSGRAVTVGAPTAGNVEAVLPFCLRDGSQAWVASGVLAPIFGMTWQGDGVQPDVSAAPGTELAASLDWLSGQLTGQQ